MKSWHSFFLGVLFTITISLVIAFGGIFLFKSGEVEPPSKVRLTKMNAGTIQSAISEYFQDCTYYPKSLENLISRVPECKNWGPEPYLVKIPKDGFGNSFLYTLSGSTYRLLSLGRDMKEGGTGLDMDFVVYETDFPTKEIQVEIPFSRRIKLASNDCETEYELLRLAHRDFYMSARNKILQICNEDIDRSNLFRSDLLKLNLSCKARQLILTGNYAHKCHTPESKDTYSKLNLRAEENVSNSCDLSWTDLMSIEKRPSVTSEAREKCQKGFRETKNHYTYKCSSGKLTAVVNSDLLCIN